MNIQHNTDDMDNVQAMPASPFLAERKDGGLFIVAQNAGDNSYQAMNLDGRGGCAIGDILTGMNEARVRSAFVPLTYSITLKNDWRAWRQSEKAASDDRRLWGALKKIADRERGGCLGKDADEMIDLARDAIGRD